MELKSLKIGDLNIKVPIIQGGMGVGISLSGLASAVANEGGVGVISSAGLGLLYKNFSLDYLKASIFGLKEEIRKARESGRITEAKAGELQKRIEDMKAAARKRKEN